jgi:hypothetical protein
MKINRVVTMVGATTTTGKLASDMYDLDNKTYYSESKGQEIPISEMDFQYMVRAFVKLCDQENMLDRSKHMGTTKDLVAKIETRDYTLEELRKEKDEAVNEGVSLANQVEGLQEDFKAQERIIDGLRSQVETLRGLLKEKEELLDKEIVSKNNWREAYYDDCSTRGSRYIFTEIPNNEYGKKLTRGMKVYLNDESYTMRVRGQHIKPELRGTGATYWGQSIEESTHLRVYIDKKKA